MKEYTIKKIENGYLFRIDEEVVTELYFETEAEAFEALSLYTHSQVHLQLDEDADNEDFLEKFSTFNVIIKETK